MKSTSRLAEFFDRQREVIEAAEQPFAKLAVFVLPILAPSVPAFVTSLHMYQLFLEILTFSNKYVASFIISSAIGLVLEMLGYVGAINFIKSLFDYVRRRKDEYLLPLVLNFSAYAFYLVAMYLINVKLGQYFEVAPIVNSIIGLLAFITVPTGLLAANHLSVIDVKSEEEKLRQEKRQDRLNNKLIKAGIDPRTNIFQGTTVAVKEKPRDWRNLSDEQKYRVVHVLSVKEIMDEFPVSEATAYNWKKQAL
jgi:hypothetical protein